MITLSTIVLKRSGFFEGEEILSKSDCIADQNLVQACGKFWTPASSHSALKHLSAQRKETSAMLNKSVKTTVWSSWREQNACNENESVSKETQRRLRKKP